MFLKNINGQFVFPSWLICLRTGGIICIVTRWRISLTHTTILMLIMDSASGPFY